MKTNKAIIYDDTCPMCRWYTTQFVATGILEEDNRISFAALEQTDLACQIDFEKGRHEIPLVDLEGGRTLYGLDSLVHLLNPRFPIIGKALKIKPIHWFFTKLYQLVSYNRRVIAPSRKQKIVFDCTPDFDLKYRLLYIVFAAVVGSVLLYAFGNEFLEIASFNTIFSALWSLLFTITFFLTKALRIDYLGQLSTVLLIGGLLISFGFLFPSMAYFIGILTGLVMLWQYIKRFYLMFVNHYSSI